MCDLVTCRTDTQADSMKLSLDNLRKRRASVLSDLLNHESSFLTLETVVQYKNKRPFIDYTPAIFIKQQVTNLYVFSLKHAQIKWSLVENDTIILTLNPGLFIRGISSDNMSDKKPQSPHIMQHSEGIKVFFLTEKTIAKLQLKPEMCWNQTVTMKTTSVCYFFTHFIFQFICVLYQEHLLSWSVVCIKRKLYAKPAH